MKLKKKIAAALASLVTVSAIGITAAAYDEVKEITESTNGKYFFRQSIQGHGSWFTNPVEKKNKGMTSTVKVSDGIYKAGNLVVCNVMSRTNDTLSASDSKYVSDNGETITLNYNREYGNVGNTYRLAFGYASGQSYYDYAVITGYWTP